MQAFAGRCVRQHSAWAASRLLCCDSYAIAVAHPLAYSRGAHPSPAPIIEFQVPSSKFSSLCSLDATLACSLADPSPPSLLVSAIPYTLAQPSALVLDTAACVPTPPLVLHVLQHMHSNVLLTALMLAGCTQTLTSQPHWWEGC